MAHALSDMRAQCEGFLSSGEETRKTLLVDVIMAFIDDELLRPLGLKCWTGSWKNVSRPDHTDSDAVAAYAADAGLESSSATARVRGVCVTPGRSVGARMISANLYAHPNGMSRCSREDAVCLKWLHNTDGCSRDQCAFKHTNG
jgi:hypothetical protein